MKNKFLLLLILSIVIFPHLTLANGGDQRVKDGYLVNLSRSPFTPVVGIKTAMLASFVDLKTGMLIKDDILVSIRIAEGRGSRTFIHEKENIPVKGGVLEYSYTFENSGMHEIFFDFTFVNDPAKQVHELPDFLIDVQSQVLNVSWKEFLMSGIIGFILGIFAMWMRRKLTI